MDKIIESLKILGTRGVSQRVFIFLAEHGVSPVLNISEQIHIPKASIYDALTELQGSGLVIEYNQGRSKEYGSISEEQLKDLVKRKISDLQSAEGVLLTLMKQQHTDRGPIKPKIKFYTGTEGIRQAFRDTMWHEKCKETYLMWPTNDMIDILTPEFSEWHSNQRLQHNVMMYVIRKHSDRKLDKISEDKNNLLESEGWKKDREIRYAPKDSDWSMSYWVYDDKCLFASSAGEQFALIVQSREFAELLTLLWKQMWNISIE